MKGGANAEHRCAGRQCAERGGPQQARARTDGDDDEHDLKPFQQHGLKGSHPGDPRARGHGATVGFGELTGLREKDHVLVVQRQDAGGAQDGLAQPPHPEQKKKDANDQLQKMKRHLLQERSEQSDQPAQDQKGGRRAKRGRLPAAQGGDGEHDSESLDDLDQRGGKSRADGGRNGAPDDRPHDAALGLRRSIHHVIAKLW